MKKLHYNYVIFGNGENCLRPTPDGYDTICLKDLDNKDGILNLYSPVCQMPFILRLLYRMHHSGIATKLHIPFKEFWYPIYFRNIFKENKPLCIVLFQRLPVSYLRYIKKRYPNSRIVLTYRDLKKITEIKHPDLPNNKLIDLECSIDANEAKKYGWMHFTEIESKIEVPISKNYPESDVFFAGKAKDRLPRLLEAYSIFTSAGLKCKYYLTGVPLADRKCLPGIVYADGLMKYTEMLYHTVNTRCVLEINQSEAVGYTSRFLEAVMFNKRLITDNQDVKKSPFYSSQNILCISKISDIIPEFVSNRELVNYNYTDEFSPIYLIEKIDTELAKRYGR